MKAEHQSPDTETPQAGPETPPSESPPEAVILPLPSEASEPARLPAPPQKRGQVHVARNLLDLVNQVFVSSAQQQREQEQHDLEAIIQKILVAGLIVSSALMLTGLGLDLLFHREAPTVVPDFRDILLRVVALRPSGFLALGLLTLIATPILRVLTALLAYIYERDWRYTLITLIVFLIVLSSILFGSG
jgi:uncharacterized membrane protein